jgi:hypothetical protein
MNWISVVDSQLYPALDETMKTASISGAVIFLFDGRRPAHAEGRRCARCE